MISKVRCVSQLSRSEVGIILQAVIFFVLTAPILKIFGFKRTSQILQLNSSHRESKDSNEIANVIHRAYLIQGVANNLPFHTSCLARSLVLQRILKSQYIESVLHIGIPKDQRELQEFKAHAWVEYQGTPINDILNIEAKYHKIYSQIQLHP